MNILEKIQNWFKKPEKTQTTHTVDAATAAQYTKYGKKINVQKLIKELYDEIDNRIQHNSKEYRVYEIMIRRPQGMPQETFEDVLESYKGKGYKIITFTDFPYLCIISWK